MIMIGYQLILMVLNNVTPPEQRLPGRGLPVDQPPGHGVAALRGPGRVRTQPEGQRGARGPHGERQQRAGARGPGLSPVLPKVVGLIPL